MESFVRALRANDHLEMVNVAQENPFWEEAKDKAFDLALLSCNTLVMDLAWGRQLAIPPLRKCLLILSKTESHETLEWILSKVQEPQSQSEAFVPIIDSLKLWWTVPILLQADAIDLTVHDFLLVKSLIVHNQHEEVEQIVQMWRAKDLAHFKNPEFIALAVHHASLQTLSTLVRYIDDLDALVETLPSGIVPFIDCSNLELVKLVIYRYIVPPKESTSFLVKLWSAGTFDLPLIQDTVYESYLSGLLATKGHEILETYKPTPETLAMFSVALLETRDPSLIAHLPEIIPIVYDSESMPHVPSYLTFSHEFITFLAILSNDKDNWELVADLLQNTYDLQLLSPAYQCVLMVVLLSTFVLHIEEIVELFKPYLRKSSLMGCVVLGTLRPCPCFLHTALRRASILCNRELPSQDRILHAIQPFIPRKFYDFLIECPDQTFDEETCDMLDAEPSTTGFTIFHRLVTRAFNVSTTTSQELIQVFFAKTAESDVSDPESLFLAAFFNQFKPVGHLHPEDPYMFSPASNLALCQYTIRELEKNELFADSVSSDSKSMRIMHQLVVELIRRHKEPDAYPELKQAALIKMPSLLELTETVYELIELDPGVYDTSVVLGKLDAIIAEFLVNLAKVHELYDVYMSKQQP